MAQLLDFFKSVMTGFAGAWNWLTTPLDWIDMSPIGIFSIAGIAIIIGFKVFNLVNPVG